jgi:hypothetical protein
VTRRPLGASQPRRARSPCRAISLRRCLPHSLQGCASKPPACNETGLRRPSCGRHEASEGRSATKPPNQGGFLRKACCNEMRALATKCPQIAQQQHLTDLNSLQRRPRVRVTKAMGRQGEDRINWFEASPLLLSSCESRFLAPFTAPCYPLLVHQLTCPFAASKLDCFCANT